ncbi:MobF family relaxase [Pseudohongiella sp.]|uniref:TrwC relaxase domain-containing protein n=1 Tax=marine sediment metagenome TaxID=412755 RepID=A0A0F9W5I9_9ZZZZ|nr:MobF family relaxase [Pseudohongiella sp.]HDZ09192.1 exonuclease V subunit alpha [Pseudohongiella sp.]
MVATWNPAASSSYYTTQTQYYLEGNHIPSVWYCPSGQLDIYDGSQVDIREFENLFAGIDTNGESLLPASGRRTDRIPAFDYTMSASRSVSLLWAGGGPETKLAIEHAQAKAVRAALSVLEREASYGRRGKGGLFYEKVALTAACFQHGDSRPARHSDGREFGDPNLHTHCVIPNLAVRADGTIGALHSTVLRDWKMAAGATYHAALAFELQKLGYTIDRIGHNGTFEIAGIDDEIIGYFSARHNEIVDELSEAGTTGKESPELAASVSKSTRSAKLPSHDLDSDQIWREAALANGFDISDLHRLALEAANGRDLATLSADILPDYRSDVICELMETRSVVDRRDLIRAGTAELVGSGLTPEQIANRIEGLVKDDDFVALGTDVIGALRYSTPDRIKIEKNVVHIASNMAQENWHEIDPADITERFQQHGLSVEQSAAALAACSTARIACIEGSPGSGKTTTLAPIVEAYKNAGLRVIGAASAWRIANELKVDLQIETRALASWLEVAHHNHRFLDHRTLLIVDEAGLMSSEDTHKLLQAVEKSGAKVVLVGDRDQLQAIGGAGGLPLVARAVENSSVSTIVRQHEAWARDAVTALGNGDAGAALGAFAERGLLIEAEGDAASIREIGDRWAQLRRSNPAKSMLLIAKTNAEVRAINEQIRSRLKAEGVVYGPEIPLSTITPSGHTAKINLAAGDEIRFLKRDDGLGVINGTTATVLHVAGRTENADLETQVVDVSIHGRRLSFPLSTLADDKNRLPISHAYASTIYGAQGLTVDNAIVLLSPAYDKHDTYVAASRARDSTQLVVNKNIVNKSIRLGQSAPFIDRDTEPSQAERIRWLAARLSRSNIKESTVDLLEYEACKRAALQLRPLDKRQDLELGA